jgi:transcriptional regulator with XRE-family HTH domain
VTGDQLAIVRRRAGLSQTDLGTACAKLAQRAGVSTMNAGSWMQVINRWERGARTPAPALRAMVYQALGALDAHLSTFEPLAQATAALGGAELTAAALRVVADRIGGAS